MFLDADQLRDMRKENLKHSIKLTIVPPAEWPASILAANGDGGDVLQQLWRSRTYLVQVFQQGKYRRLSVQRTEWDKKKKRFADGISWDELQQVKADVGYGDHCALEVYPPESLVINVANIRHLFILSKGELPGFVWTDNLLK